MWAATVGGLIGAAGVVLGVWLSQFLSDRHATARRLDSAFIEIQPQFGLLCEALDETGKLTKAWGDDYRTFNALVGEIDSLAAQLSNSYLRAKKRNRFKACELSLQDFQMRFGAAVGNLKRGGAISEDDVFVLGRSLNHAKRVLMSDYGTYDPAAELGTFVERVRYFMGRGIGAERPDGWPSLEP